MQKLVRDLVRPRDGTVAAPGSGALIDHPEMIDTAFSVMLVDGIREVATQVQSVRVSLATLEEPGKHAAPGAAPAREPFSLTSAKMRKAAGSGLAMVLLGWFFIETQWPMGLMLSMVFASIAIALGAMVPLTLVRRQLLLSLIIGAAIAAPIYFGIMPRIDRYEQLIPWLCLALFPLVYLIASRPQIKIQTLFSAIFVIALLSLDEEGQSYSFSSFVNMWLGLCGGFAGALAVLGLFSSVVPEQEFCKQVRAFFDQCGQFLRELAASEPGAGGAAVVKAGHQRWHGILKQLRTWSSAINYEQVPANNGHKTQALMESIEHLALHLAAGGQVRRQFAGAVDEPLREVFDRFHGACVESFQLIANAPADLKPIPDLPDTASLVREIESRADDLRRSAAGDDDNATSLRGVMRATAYMNLMAGELSNCRDKVNAIDWKKWNQNYF